MSMAKIRFSRKTLAIALAAGVSFGGVTVPQIAGVEGVTAVASAAETIETGKDYPVFDKTVWEKTPGGPGTTNYAVVVSHSDVEKGSFTINNVVEDGKNTTAKLPEDRSQDELDGFDSINLSPGGDLTVNYKPGVKRSWTGIRIELTDTISKQVRELYVWPIEATRLNTPVVSVSKDDNGVWRGALPEVDVYFGTEAEGLEGTTTDFYRFPRLGQPSNVSVPGDTDYNDPSTNIMSVGNKAVVDGQGTWEFSEKEVTFTPEKGFTGKPTFPRIAVIDAGAVNTWANYLMYYASNDSLFTDKDTQWYLYYNAAFIVPEDMKAEAEKDPDFNPNIPTPAPAEDLHVTNVEKDKKGDYVVTRSDGKPWTIELKDIRDKLAELDKKDTVSPEDLAKVKDDLNKKIEDITDKVGPLEDAVNDNTDAIKDLRKDLNDLEGRVDGLEDRIDALEDAVIKEVRDNGDGTYTLIRENGDEVKGNIDTSGSVTNIKTDGKGNLVITIDGKDKKVPLDQVKITESNKGTPDHTVTITTPDGKSVTFNVFDNYVVDVKREKDGNYKVVRNDGTEWVINLKDIRDKIAALEAKESPSRDEFNKVKDEIDNLKKEIDGLKATDKKLEDDIANIKNDITNLDIRITKIESRLTAVEDRTDALTKCVAGAGAAGIPALLSIPLMVMTQLNIPGIKDLNTQIQKQIGIYNPDLARAWERSGGVLQAGAVLAGLAGIIGSIAYIANQCDPMMKTPAGQDTDLGKLSSKVEKAKTESSSKKTESEKTEQNTPAESAAEAEANTDAEAATAPSEELVDAQ